MLSVPGDIIVSGPSVNWPAYVVGGREAFADCSPFDFSVNLLCFVTLFETIATGNRLLTSSRAEAVPSSYPPNLPIIRLDAEMTPAALLQLYGEGSEELSKSIDQRIRDSDWYDMLVATRLPQDAEAWRDLVAAELAAATILARQRRIPIAYNILEATLSPEDLAHTWVTIEGPSFFSQALSLCHESRDLLPLALSLRGSEQAQAWTETIARAVRESPPHRVAARESGVLWHFALLPETGDLSALVVEPPTNYELVERIFGIAAAEVFIQLDPWVRKWRDTRSS